MATLKDVGREAGVGVSTASMVLSGGRLSGNIPAVTQQRIRDAALRLKYRPNAGGRQLKHLRTRTVALFASAEEHRSFVAPEMLNAINDELFRRDYALQFVRLPDVSLSDPLVTPRFLRQQEVDGVLVNYVNDMPQRFVDLIHHYEMPAVFLNDRRPSCAVYFDHVKAAGDAVERLAAIGHRRLYLVSFSGSYGHYNITDSVVGYQAAMRARGLTPVFLDERVEPADRLRAGMDLLRMGAAGHPPPSAVLTLSPRSAIPLVQAAARIGRRIPEDFSLVTADGSGLPGSFTPALSHIVLPWDKAGRVGVQMLLNLIEGRSGENVTGCVECEWSADGGTVAPVSAAFMEGAER